MRCAWSAAAGTRGGQRTRRWGGKTASCQGWKTAACRMIAIVDSGVANLGSVEAAFRRIGIQGRVTADGRAVRCAAAVLLPGVGSFADAMATLLERQLVEPIRAAAADGVPVMGICLGMQLLAEQSEEFGCHEGLGLIPGRVVRL